MTNGCKRLLFERIKCGKQHMVIAQVKDNAASCCNFTNRKLKSLEHPLRINQLKNTPLYHYSLISESCNTNALNINFPALIYNCIRYIFCIKYGWSFLPFSTSISYEVLKIWKQCQSNWSLVPALFYLFFFFSCTYNIFLNQFVALF